MNFVWDAFSVRSIPKEVGCPPTKDERMMAIRTPLFMRVCINSGLILVKKNDEFTNMFTNSVGRAKKKKETFFKTKTVTGAICPTGISHGKRMFLVDSGASMHLVSKSDLIHEGQETFRKSK